MRTCSLEICPISQFDLQMLLIDLYFAIKPSHLSHFRIYSNGSSTQRLLPVLQSQTVDHTTFMKMNCFSPKCYTMPLSVNKSIELKQVGCVRKVFFVACFGCVTCQLLSAFYTAFSSKQVKNMIYRQVKEMLKLNFLENSKYFVKSIVVRFVEQ